MLSTFSFIGSFSLDGFLVIFSLHFYSWMHPAPKFLHNGDSPIGRRVTDPLFSNPEVSNLAGVYLTSSGSEVFTTAFPERTSVVSYFEGNGNQSFASGAFEKRFDDYESGVTEEILKCSSYTVKVYSFYTPIDESDPNISSVPPENEGAVFSSPRVPSVINETVCYAGSGIIFEKNGHLYVLTARHNILSKRRPSPDKPHNLQRKLIRVTLPHHTVTRVWRNATRHDKPTHENADLRKSHTMEEMEGIPHKWRHNSDFAVLKVGDDPNAGNRNKCDFQHYLRFEELQHNVSVNPGDEVFVYGFLLL